MLFQMITELKAANFDRQDVDEVMFLRGAALILKQGYQSKLYEVPEWLNERIAAIDKEIERRRTDQLQKELKEAKARREGLLSRDEKRREEEAKIARIEKALGINQPAPAAASNDHPGAVGHDD